MTELVKADGQEMIEPEQRRLWKELKAKNEQADKELSVEELEAVSGGADRDWSTDGCAATVEAGSWCGSNDSCYIWDVTYSNMPSMTCLICNGAMSFIEYNGREDIYQCTKCGRIRKILDSDDDDNKCDRY